MINLYDTVQGTQYKTLVAVELCTFFLVTCFSPPLAAIVVVFPTNLFALSDLSVVFDLYFVDIICPQWKSAVPSLSNLPDSFQPILLKRSSQC